jgi:hypothetical protein
MTAEKDRAMNGINRLVTSTHTFFTLFSTRVHFS